jgi:hypothetical protein
MMLRLIKEKIKEPVWVYRGGEKSGWLSIGPDDLRTQPSIVWDISPESPSGQIVEQRADIEAIQAGILTREEAIVRAGRSPAEHRKYMLKEQLRGTPEYQAVAMAEFLGTIGRGDLATRYAAASQVAQSGIVPGPNGLAPGGPDLGGVTGGMGAGGVPPDTGALTMSPNGAGAKAATVPMTTPGSVPGYPSMPSVPTQAATASIQRLGP